MDGIETKIREQVEKVVIMLVDNDSARIEMTEALYRSVMAFSPSPRVRLVETPLLHDSSVFDKYMGKVPEVLAMHVRESKFMGEVPVVRDWRRDRMAFLSGIYKERR